MYVPTSLTCLRSLAEYLTVQYPSSSAFICSGGEALALGSRSASANTGGSLFSLSAIKWGGLVWRDFFTFSPLSLSSMRGVGWLGCGCSEDLLVMSSDPAVSNVLLEGKRFSLELRGVARGVSYGCALVWFPSSVLNILHTLELDVGDTLSGAA